MGEVIEGIPNGHGTITYPDEHNFTGEFKDGKRDGQGTYSFPDGSKTIGEFKENPWNTIDYNKDGNIIGKIVNGETH